MPAKPEMIGLMGYTVAKENGNLHKGLELCNIAIRIDPFNPDNYLYLGRLYITAGKRELAIKIFRKGLKIRKDVRIIDELNKLGIRKPPPFNSLPRDHKLNIMVGKILRCSWLKS